jgi:type VI secretion system protein ImpF
MAELTPQERLQPALLDRLTDEEPTNRKPEPREQRVITKRKLREAVLRDLVWLFNTTRLASGDELSGFPYAERSVINFGLPALSGETASTLDVIDLEAGIRQAIIDFEPRIDPSTLEVETIVSGERMDNHNLVGLQIRGQLWAEPVRLDLLLRTEVDLETGNVLIRDLAKSGM